ncbi:hypothetical protein MES5069_620002 [Mesorhizobium escarrei]|uniref:Uncharacterized protein n=1 Tax=Mesorhizobium escarrei TaxID=666018 RepID=A0ABM9EE97_9HYPH|nr:hypothetical protein MES5069_620002 [Mesorhizobium escarrei]
MRRTRRCIPARMKTTSHRNWFGLGNPEIFHRQRAAVACQSHRTTLSAYVTLPLLAASATGVSFFLDLSARGAWRILLGLVLRWTSTLIRTISWLQSTPQWCMPHGDEPQILLYPFSFLWVMAHAAPQGGVIPTAVGQILNLKISETCRCYRGHSGVTILW